MKINLNDAEQMALTTLVSNGGDGVKVLKKLFRTGILELKDVETVDAKGNMGLQTLARQNALGILREIASKLFPKDVAQKRVGADMEEGEEKISEWA